MKHEKNVSNSKKGGKSRGNSRSRRSKANHSSNAGDNFDSRSDRSGMKMVKSDGESKIIGKAKYDNDLGWYTRVSSLLDPVAKVPMIPIHGTQFTITAQNEKQNVTIPGIMVLEYHPVLPTEVEGLTSQANSSLFKMVMKNVYAQIKRNLNGPRQYNTADLMSYMLVITSITAYMHHIRRSYEMTFYTNPYSRYSREQLVDAATQSYVYDEWVNQAPYLIQLYNSIAIKLRNMVTPGVLPLKERWKWLNSHMFADANVEKPQLIIPKPMGYYYIDYSDATAENPYKLTYKLADNSDQGNRISSTLNFIAKVVDEMLSNDTISLINADIMKAYGEVEMNHVDTIDPDQNFIFLPIHSEEFNLQLKGLTFSSVTPEAYKIQLSTVSYDFSFKLALKGLNYQSNMMGDILIGTNDTEVTKDHLVMSTRMTSLIEYTSSQQIKGIVLGTELFTQMRIFTKHSKDYAVNCTSNYIDATISQEKSDLMTGVNILAALSVFEAAPFLYIQIENTTTAGRNNSMFVVGDVNNYATLSFDQFKDIQIGVLASLVGVDDNNLISKEFYAKNR